MTHPAVATLSTVVDLQKKWPKSVRLTLSEIPDGPLTVDAGGANIFGYHPYLFAPAFPAVRPEDLARLSVAAWLFANVMFGVDHIEDGDAIAPGPLDLLAGQFEGYRVLAGLFPVKSPVWDVLRERLSDFGVIAARQREFARGERELTDFPLELAIDTAQAKASLATVTVAALGELSPGPVEALTRSIHAYSVATQLLDDIQDWRADLAARRPSYPLARAAKIAGEQGLDDANRIGRALYFDGVLTHTIDLVLEQLADARAAVADLRLVEWVAHLDHVAATADAVRLSVARRPRPKVSVRVPVRPHRPWWSLATRCLRWLLSQWQLGFPDANHVMSFPGMSVPGPHVGNIFSRALITSALVEVDRKLTDGALRPCVMFETDHLLESRRIGEPGMWAYFPGLPELPCDVDDLAEILRVLTRTGRVEALATELDSAVKLALQEPFSTWLPANDLQRHGITLWGERRDPEVIANLLHAAAERDPHLDGLDRGVDHLLATQSPEGWWKSGWYRGHLYGTYQCIRAITTLRPNEKQALTRATNAVLAMQNPDGGWANTGEESDALGTACALLALAHSGSRDAAERGLRWLDDHADDRGVYPSVPFIVMTPDRSPGLAAELDFGSASITTALVCLAATTWEWLT